MATPSTKVERHVTLLPESHSESTTFDRVFALSSESMQQLGPKIAKRRQAFYIKISSRTWKVKALMITPNFQNTEFQVSTATLGTIHRRHSTAAVEKGDSMVPMLRH